MPKFVAFETDSASPQYVNVDRVQRLHAYASGDGYHRTVLYFDKGDILVVLGQAHQISEQLSR